MTRRVVHVDGYERVVHVDGYEEHDRSYTLRLRTAQGETVLGKCQLAGSAAAARAWAAAALGITETSFDLELNMPPPREFPVGSYVRVADLEEDEAEAQVGQVIDYIEGGVVVRRPRLGVGIYPAQLLSAEPGFPPRS